MENNILWGTLKKAKPFSSIKRKESRMFTKSGYAKKRIVDLKLLEEIRKRPCLATGRPGPNDAHHIKTVGSGGGDTIDNVISLCRQAHTEYHTIGAYRFSEKYEGFKNWLEFYDWYFDEYKKLRKK